MRAVYDTNVLVSAFEFGGKPRQVFLLALNGTVALVLSPALLAELADVLKRKFAYSDGAIAYVFDLLANMSDTVTPVVPLAVLTDEADNRVLEAAHEGKCDYIVTGDKKLLELGEYRNVNVVSVDGFLSAMV